jgi:lipopolysaccharide/colanic/teichoic acid biosynthesis glycosyltransferase
LFERAMTTESRIMEPDTLATRSKPLADSSQPHTAPPSSNEWPFVASDDLEEALAMLPVSPEVVPSGNGASHANGSSYTHASNGGKQLNGHANGNGHVNGSGHDYSRVAGWPAILAPVPAGGALPLPHAPAHPHPPVARHDWYMRFGKRALDGIGALVALIVTAPVLIVCAILIKLESRGPVLYRSTRVGRGGRPFTFFKLRSMVDGADQHREHLTHLNECDGPVFKISRDPRVTRIGRFLRITSIDEIPNFWNVLCGDMSLVGPRPALPEEVTQYEPWQMRRLEVRPGITCLWQISGRSNIGFGEWMRLDLEYIRHQSFWTDTRILIRTVPAVLSREGAY